MRARLTVLVACLVLVTGFAVGARLLGGSSGSTTHGAVVPARAQSSTAGPTIPPPHPTVVPKGGAQPLPDGFVPSRLRPGERPPQFVVVSFDGAGWHEMWQHWFDVADRVPFRFTGFL